MTDDTDPLGHPMTLVENFAGLSMMAGPHLEPMQALGLACKHSVSCLACRLSV